MFYICQTNHTRFEGQAIGKTWKFDVEYWFFIMWWTNYYSQGWFKVRAVIIVTRGCYILFSAKLVYRYRNQFVLMLERKLQFRDVSIEHGVWLDGERFEREQRLNWMNKNPTVLEYQIIRLLRPTLFVRVCYGLPYR